MNGEHSWMSGRKTPNGQDEILLGPWPLFGAFLGDSGSDPTE